MWCYFILKLLKSNDIIKSVDNDALKNFGGEINNPLACGLSRDMLL